MAQTLRYWFRQKYLLTPNDQRYLDMTDEDIALEYEADLAFNGETLKQCFQCEAETHRQHCPTCKNPDGTPVSLSGDTNFDDAVAKMESGEDVDIEQLLRGPFVPVEK